jgi:hypothetical protein
VNIQLRHIVALAILLFAWKGSEINLQWPPAGIRPVVAAKPDAALLPWVDDLKPLLPKMLPKDREYLAAFYDAMAFVLLQDGDREKPIVSDTEKFAAFHAGSLQLAIKKANVGKYPGLDSAIDSAFFKAAGAETAPISKEKRTKLAAACGVLSWAFHVNHE